MFIFTAEREKLFCCGGGEYLIDDFVWNIELNAMKKETLLKQLGKQRSLEREFKFLESQCTANGLLF